MYDNPRVSVVIPTKNRASILESAIRTALLQTEARLEVIVVDDGSTDETPALVQKLSREDARVRYFRNPTSIGAPGTRNRGLREAAAEFVIFNDDDCTWTSSKVEKQLLAMAAPEVGVSYSSMYLTHLDGFEERVGKEAGVDGPWFSLLKGNYISPPMAMIRRSLLLRVGGFAEDMPRLQDWELWLRLLVVTGTDFVFVPDEIVYSAYLPGGITSEKERLVLAAHLLSEKTSSWENFNARDGALLHNTLGHMLLSEGNPREAAAYFWKALKQGRGSSLSALYPLAIALSRRFRTSP